MANLLSTIVSGRLSIGSSTATPYLTTAPDGIVFGGNEVGNAYRLYTDLENYGGNYTKLNIAWHTGIKIGAYYGYGGTRFYNNSPASGAEIFSVGKGDNHVRVENNLYVGNTIYNNGNAVIHAGNIGSQSVSYAASAGNSTNLNGLSSSRYLYYRGINVASDFQTYQSSESIIRFDQVNDYNTHSNPPGGYTYGGVLSMRGNNFGFQLWGSHTGDFYFKTQWDNDQYSGWRYIVHSGNIGSQSVNYASSAGNADTVDSLHASVFLRNDIYNSTGAGLQVFRNIGSNTGSWPDADHTFGLENSDNGNIVINFHRAGYTSNNLLYTGSAFRFDTTIASTSDVRAPIFYDSNDTGYYGDFASTSVMNSIRFGSSTNNGTISGGGDWGVAVTTDNGYIRFGPANSSWAHIYSNLNFFMNTHLWVSGGYKVTAWDYNNGGGSLYANVFYDSDNTGYYLDPNSASRLLTTITNLTYFGFDTNKGYAQGWNTYSSTLHKIAYVSFDWNGNYDTYSNHGIASTDSNGNFADSVSINSFNDITFRLDSNSNNGDSYVRFMNDTTGSNAFSSLGYNGSTYYASFSRDLYIDGNRGGNFGNRLVIGGTTTPYTLQDTNLRPTAYLRGAYPVLTLDHTETGNTEHGPTIQFVFNGSNARQWLIGCGGSGNFMDFGFSSSGYGNTNYNPHNGISGYQGNTIMRIVDNAVGIGGDWGAYGANANPAYTLDVRGTIYSNTDMRAPIFYDSNDTNYYVDPNSTSVLNALTLNGRLNAYSNIVYLNEIRFTNTAGSTQSDPYTMRWISEDSARGAGLSWLEFQLNDDSNEEIRIYGNSCAGFSCGTYSDNLYHRFRADGYAWHAGTMESPTVYGSTTVYSPTILVNNHSDNTRGYRIHNTSGSSVSAMFTNSSNQLVIAAGALDQINLNKKVYVNGVALGVNVTPSATAGRIDASNDIVAYSSSDERLKQNITPIENALDKVKSLTGVEFDWKPEYKQAHGYEGHDTGIIAQQVQAVIPSAVRTNDTGFLAVRYEKLIGLLIEANKELAARVEELEKKLN